jgi:hypothetical protein
MGALLSARCLVLVRFPKGYRCLAGIICRRCVTDVDHPGMALPVWVRDRVS